MNCVHIASTDNSLIRVLVKLTSLWCKTSWDYSLWIKFDLLVINFVQWIIYKYIAYELFCILFRGIE
jgi:hypothetical protein